MSLRRRGEEVRDLSRRMRIGDVHDAQAVGEPRHRNVRSRHALARLVATGEVRLGLAVDARDLEAREGNRPPLVRDVHEPQERRRAGLELGHVLVGLGFGGWIAAEMATMAPQAFRRLVLVGAMGVKPAQGEILDQALVSYIGYVRAGFEDQSAFDRLYGADPSTPQLEQWDLNREMTFRIAWKPYMYNPTLPHLLGGVRSRALIVWGRGDKVVPLECAEAYARALPGSRLSVVEKAGHFVDMEQPETLAKLISEF